MWEGNNGSQISNAAILHSKDVVEGEESVRYQAKNMIDGRLC